jgi:hypothetical protein
MSVPAQRNRSVTAQAVILAALVLAGLGLYLWAVPRMSVVVTPAIESVP